jgi:hypothetical protein
MRIGLALDRAFLRRKLARSRGSTLNDSQGLAILVCGFHPIRYWNIRHILESALKCDFVDTIWISNNNPAHVFPPWLYVADERVRIIEQPVVRTCEYRYQILNEMPGEYFAVLDDDHVLMPGQIGSLFRSLLKEPDRPHGFYGEDYPMDPAQFIDGRTWHVNSDATVTNLNRGYFVTRKHVREFHALVRGLRLQEVTHDDLIVGFSGERFPRIHDVGSVYECRTEAARGVALWSDHDFLRERRDILLQLRAWSKLEGRPVRDA